MELVLAGAILVAFAFVVYSLKLRADVKKLTRVPPPPPTEVGPEPGPDEPRP